MLRENVRNNLTNKTILRNTNVTPLCKDLLRAPLALIQGANRGLGILHLLKNKFPAVIIASCRNPDGAEQLRNLFAQHTGSGGCLYLMNNEGDIRAASVWVKKTFGRLDLLVLCLTPLGKGNTRLRDVSLTLCPDADKMGCLCEDPRACAVCKQKWHHNHTDNKHSGPSGHSQVFCTPSLQKGGGGSGQQPEEKAKQHSGIIVNITAKVGSIGDNWLGGWYSYRMFKAALNMATRNLSIELGRSRSKVLCVSLHPGTLNTKLGVKCLMSIINTLNINKTGKAYSWDGTELPCDKDFFGIYKGVFDVSAAVVYRSMLELMGTNDFTQSC